MKKRTRVTHLPDVEVPPDNRALVAPIYQSVKFTFDDVAETERYCRGPPRGFYYSRVSNPTLRQLENALAELQGRDALPADRVGDGRDLGKPADRSSSRATTSSISPRCTSRRAA